MDQLRTEGQERWRRSERQGRRRAPTGRGSSSKAAHVGEKEKAQDRRAARVRTKLSALSAARGPQRGRLEISRASCWKKPISSSAS